MKPSERIVTFPTMGKNNLQIIKEFLESLELKVLITTITDETIKRGVKYSPQMMCFPYKVTLGSYIDSLEKGANTLLMFNSKGQCRFKQYHHLQKFMLNNMEYNFEMYDITFSNLISVSKRLSGKSYLEVLRKTLKSFNKIKESDRKNKIWSNEIPNIGIIGEIFCCSDEQTNSYIEEKIRRFGCNPYNMCQLSDFVNESLSKYFGKFTSFFGENLLRKYKEELDGCLDTPVGGHGYENLANLLFLRDKGVDGVVHLMPLSCCPESVAEPYIDKSCRDNKIPLLRIAIDENKAEKNLETRLEVFTEMIKLRKNKK